MIRFRRITLQSLNEWLVTQPSTGAHRVGGQLS